MSTRHLPATALSLLLSFAVACGDEAGGGSSGDADRGSADGAEADDDETGGGDDDAHDGDNGVDEDGPTAACLRYVDCVAAAQPETLAQIESAYGRSGTCWDGDASARDACDEGCRAALASAHQDAPNNERCAECGTDAHCSGARGRCDAAGECVECLDDADCAEGMCVVGTCRTGAACLEDVLATFAGIISEQCEGVCEYTGCLAELDACTDAELCSFLVTFSNEGLSEPCSESVRSADQCVQGTCCE